MNHVKKHLCHNQHIMNEIVNNLTPEAIGHHTKNNLIGVNYHLRCHTDVNMFYTLTTVIALEDICAVNVIYYFTFPTFGIMILLRSGNSFMFNPILLHSCSNPRYPGCHIMSAYVSQKTVLRSHPL